MECPRCKGSDYTEKDCVPDGFDGDIAYTSYKCDRCGLWLDGWSGKWLIDVDYWGDAKDAEEFVIST